MFGLETQYFFELTPDRILRAVESLGVRCTGRTLQLNSMENRVFELEVEVDEEVIKSPSDRFRVVKFYRPGRWSAEQIREEHEFLAELRAEDIPVIAPITNQNGQTLHTCSETGILFAVFPRQGGRAPDEVMPEHAQRIGRLLARVHTVGARRAVRHRLTLSPDTFGRENLKALLERKSLPPEFQGRYADVVQEICALSDARFSAVAKQRLHGDCHMGNVLWGSEGAFLVDFDDMLVGPCVQDLWLVVPGTDSEAQELRSILIDSYSEMRTFDRTQLLLVESLRALRYIHHSAWIAKRWEDPAFPRAFPQFGTNDYWRARVSDLEEQVIKIRADLSERIRY